MGRERSHLAFINRRTPLLIFSSSFSSKDFRWSSMGDGTDGVTRR